MPISYPRTFINTTGVHYLDKHTQHVYVNIPTSINPPSTIIYLPHSGVVAAPIKVINRGYGSSVFITGHRGKLIAETNRHQLQLLNGSNYLPSETRMELVPVVGDNGEVTGDWSIVAGNVVNFATIEWNTLTVPPDTLTPTAGFGAVDFSVLVTPVGSSLGAGLYVPAETGHYVFVVDLGLSVAAGKIVEFSIDPVTTPYFGDQFRKRQTGVSIDGETGMSWRFVFVEFCKAGVPLRFSVKHNDTVDKNCAGYVAVSRQL